MNCTCRLFVSRLSWPPSCPPKQTMEICHWVLFWWSQRHDERRRGTISKWNANDLVVLLLLLLLQRWTCNRLHRMSVERWKVNKKSHIALPLHTRVKSIECIWYAKRGSRKKEERWREREKGRVKGKWTYPLQPQPQTHFNTERGAFQVRNSYSTFHTNREYVLRLYGSRMIQSNCSRTTCDVLHWVQWWWRHYSTASGTMLDDNVWLSLPLTSSWHLQIL